MTRRAAALRELAALAKRRRKGAVSARFPAWIEANVCLPSGLAAVPGPIRVPCYLREVAESLADPAVEKITIQKGARLGATTLLSALIAYSVIERPTSVLVVVPTQGDARTYIVDVESIFDCSPALQGRLPSPATAGRNSRNVLLFRRFPGGNLRIVAAQSPRNLRGIGAQCVLLDEVDAIVVGAEGNPVDLAVARSMAFDPRKTVLTSTPLSEDTSAVARSYGESDQRIYECRCPGCGGHHELRWEDFEWPPGRPQDVRWRCPGCGYSVSEEHKPRMVRDGRWRALRPEVEGHHGFRLSALVSSLPAAGWSRLAAEHDLAKDDPDRLRVFTNVVLGLPWAEQGDSVDESALRSRSEPFGLDALPPEVLALTAGVDCADDRLEVVIVGWSRAGVCHALGHEVIHGAIGEDLTWRQLDELLRMRWRHPHGGELKIDACAIDGGDGGHLDQVLGFCRPRSAARVMCVKGASGFARHALQASKSKMKGGGRLWIVGSDSVKARLFDQLQRAGAIRFSRDLQPVFYEQLASERRVVRMVRGRPVARFERVKGARAECLDALCYAVAAKNALLLTPAAFSLREDSLRSPAPPPPRPSVVRSQWMDR